MECRYDFLVSQTDINPPRWCSNSLKTDFDNKNCAIKAQFVPIRYAHTLGSFSFKNLLGFAPFFRHRCGYKPHLPVLVSQKRVKNGKLNSPTHTLIAMGWLRLSAFTLIGAKTQSLKNWRGTKNGKSIGPQMPRM